MHSGYINLEGASNHRLYSNSTNNVNDVYVRSTLLV